MLRDGTTGDWIGTWSGHKGAVWSCRLDSTASLAGTASGDYSARIWDAVTGELVWVYPHHHIVKSCDFNPDSTLFATGGHEGILRIYDLKRQIEQSPKNPVTPHEIPLPENQNGSKIVISKLNWLNNTTLLAGCGDGKVRLYDVTNPSNNQQPIHELILPNNGSEIRDMEITRIKTKQSPQQQQLQQHPQTILTVAAGKTVYFFDLETYKLLKSYDMPIHFREEGGASLHPSGRKFIAGGSDLWVRVFDFATGKELLTLKGHHGPIRCLRYAPNGAFFASGSEDGTIRLWQDTS
jgi:serine-threonine kinase receptor-associated protein